MFQRFSNIISNVSNAISSISDESDEDEGETEVCPPPSPPPIPGPDLANMTADQKQFEEFEFQDLSPEARAMYVDRRYTHTFQVRGAGYLEDKKKTHPGPAICKLMLFELYEVESKDGDRHDHISARGLVKERIQDIAALPGNPFQIIVNFQIPGDPPISLVAYFAVPPSMKETFLEADSLALKNLFDQFVNIPATEEERMATWDTITATAPLSKASSVDNAELLDLPIEPTCGEDGSTPSKKEESVSASPSSKSNIPPAAAASTSWYSRMPQDITWPTALDAGALPQSDFRNQRFKLIPSVTEGPWVVKTAVRSVPALLGRKVVQRYFRGDGYIEIDIHVGSSVIASQIVGVCRGYGKHFAADVGIVIQGEDASELPEKMLACMSFNKIDMEVRRKLD